MAFGMNDCRYQVVLLQGSLNLSLLSMSVVKFRSAWVRLVSQNCPQFVSCDINIVTSFVCLFFASVSGFTSFGSVVLVYIHIYNLSSVCFCLQVTGVHRNQDSRCQHSAKAEQSRSPDRENLGLNEDGPASLYHFRGILSFGPGPSSGASCNAMSGCSHSEQTALSSRTTTYRFVVGIPL